MFLFFFFFKLANPPTLSSPALLCAGTDPDPFPAVEAFPSLTCKRKRGFGVFNAAASDIVSIFQSA